jgi:hypothetical protein
MVVTYHTVVLITTVKMIYSKKNRLSSCALKTNVMKKMWCELPQYKCALKTSYNNRTNRH